MATKSTISCRLDQHMEMIREKNIGKHFIWMDHFNIVKYFFQKKYHFRILGIQVVDC
jgi:hypothetical protein